jgi:hypothetical protein
MPIRKMILNYCFKPLGTLKPEVIAMNTDDLALRLPRFNGTRKMNALMLGSAFILDHQQVDEWGQPMGQPHSFNMGFYFPGWRLNLFQGHFHMGETPFAKTKILPGGVAPHRLVYRKIKGDPEGFSDDEYTYEAKSEHLLIRCSTKRTRVVTHEMDVNYDHFPYAFAVWPIQLLQPCFCHGTYKGQPLKEHLGGWERDFINLAVIVLLFGLGLLKMQYLVCVGRGIDGRRESAYIFMASSPLLDAPINLGFFHRDEEEPVVTDKAEMHDVTWKHVDGCTLPVEATYKIGNKEIYVNLRDALMPRSGFIPPKEMSAGLKGMVELGNRLLKQGKFYGASGRWREKHSPDFDMSCFYNETHFYDKDVIRSMEGMDSGFFGKQVKFR